MGFGFDIGNVLGKAAEAAENARKAAEDAAKAALAVLSRMRLNQPVKLLPVPLL